jgi:fatty acid desaturase
MKKWIKLTDGRPLYKQAITGVMKGVGLGLVYCAWVAGVHGMKVNITIKGDLLVVCFAAVGLFAAAVAICHHAFMLWDWAREGAEDVLAKTEEVK